MCSCRRNRCRCKERCGLNYSDLSACSLVRHCEILQCHALSGDPLSSIAPTAHVVTVIFTIVCTGIQQHTIRLSTSRCACMFSLIAASLAYLSFTLVNKQRYGPRSKLPVPITTLRYVTFRPKLYLLRFVVNLSHNTQYNNLYSKSIILRYFDSLSASRKDNVSPTQLIRASEDRVLRHRMVTNAVLQQADIANQKPTTDSQHLNKMLYS